MRRLASAALAAVFVVMAISLPVFAADSIDRIATFEEINTIKDNKELNWFGISSTNANSLEGCAINTDPEFAHDSSKSLWFENGSAARNFYYNTDKAIITSSQSTTEATVQLCYRFEYKYYMKISGYEDSYSDGIVFKDDPQLLYGGQKTKYNSFEGLDLRVVKSTETGAVSVQMGDNGDESIVLEDGAENDWIEILRIFNFDKSLVETYANGTLLATREIDAITAARMSKVTFGGSDNTKGVYFDDVSTLSFERPPQIEEIAAEKGDVTLTFSKPLDESTLAPECFSFTLDGKVIEASAVEYIADENKVIVTPAYALAAEKEYTVTVSGDVKSESGICAGEGEGTEATFTIPAQDFDVLDVAAEGGKIKASMVNTSGASKKAIMAVIFKNEDGAIVSFGFTNLTTIPANGKTLEVDLPNAGETCCEVFFIDSWTGRLPLWKYIYSITEVK